MNPFPDLPAESRLTERERAAVALIAAHEQAADPAFARRLSGAGKEIGAAGATSRHGGRAPLLITVALAVVGVALLLFPGLWVLATVAVGVLVVVPAVLVAWALSQGDQPPG